MKQEVKDKTLGGSGGGGGGRNKWYKMIVQVAVVQDRNKWYKTEQVVVVQQDKTSGTRLNKCKKWWLRYNTKTKETTGGGGGCKN
jgi:hypothetical protein